MVKIEANLTRRHLYAFIAIVAVVALIVPTAGWAADKFKDVPDSNIFHDDIAWLADAGVTKGCNPPTNDEFCPGDNVRRETMAAFMRRLATNQVVDAGRLQGYSAAQLISGGGPVATGAGNRYGSGDDPTILRDEVITELGALAIKVPASGGALGITASVMLDTDGPDSSSFVGVWTSLDQLCTSADLALAGSTSDLANVWFANVAQNVTISPSAGNHTVRLCAQAFHDIASDVTWVDAARISTTWTPDTMGPTASILGSTASATGIQMRARDARDAFVAATAGD